MSGVPCRSHHCVGAYGRTFTASGISAMTNLFWEDLAADLEDPKFLRAYVRESVQIAVVDAIMNASIRA